MKKKIEHPLSALAQFLPDGSFETVVNYLNRFKVVLTVTNERKTILGDYRNALRDKNHRISVNGNLNKYSFLITLLHELAHLLTFEQYGNKVFPHGNEWKANYSGILVEFVQLNVFPKDILIQLRKSIQSPAASCGGEVDLMRVLRNYDVQKEGFVLVENISQGQLFADNKGRIFRKGEQVRKRFRCLEIATGLVYLFHPVYEVRLIQPND